MEYRLYLPPVATRQYIKYFWSLDKSAGEALPPVYKSMADGYAEVVFSINGSFKEYYNYGGYVLPQHSNHRTLTIGENIGLFGVRLYPYAIFPMFGIASHEVANNVHDIHSFLGRDLVNGITEAESHAERVSVFCRCLLRKFDKAPTLLERAVHRMIETHGMERMTSLCNLLSISERQLERKFKEAVGLSPKQYSRILRFQYSKRRFVGHANSFAQIAFDCNYADQPHFARDFREFSGMTVSEYANLVNKPGSEEARVIKGLLLAKDEPYRYD
ncbi:MAG TPA: helix-turn-helix transcriptional regulator [Ohtaekwangia sp.]|nr:helix-turn-helix transcriptional regulator [Ohtaekwangia sp.]